ncbi:MAG: hypothetical protein COA63_008160 [Methylophaga sp.]|nr:hypothetical protein [Methylophaga sp.]
MEPNNAKSHILLWTVLLINSLGLACLYYANKAEKSTEIPNLIGTWSGQNDTISDEKGYKTWDNKVITITEQKDRRFRGTFTYADGTKNFFGVIYPDNISFTWVSTPARGFNHGRILDENTIGACYVEAYEQATAGCATLKRE